MEDNTRRVELISSIGEEVTTKNELYGLLSTCGIEERPYPICYDGFEPSGRIHLAQGLMKAHNIKKLIEAGCHVRLWVADVFAMLNEKFGGDMSKIKTCGEYMIEVWKACGINTEQVEFLWASEEINNHPHRYWSIVMHITTKFTVTRFKKCTKALGRMEDSKTIKYIKSQIEILEKESKFKEANDLYKQLIAIMESQYSMPLSYLMYAAMQCADIYFLEADICQLGMDQRKVNMLAREYSEVIYNERPKFIKPRPKPIIISHHMLMGLQQTADSSEAIKMSKSNPESAIFMDDTETDVNRKIKKAFCVPKSIHKNPILEYLKYVVFPIKHEFVIKQNDKYGGAVFEFHDYETLEKAYVNGEIHPGDIKPTLSRVINELLEPIRLYFKENENARNLQKRVKSFNK